MTSRKRGLRGDALRIWQAGVDAVDAGRLVRSALRVRGGVLTAGDIRVELSEVRRIVVVGAGKAGAAMAGAVEEALGPKVLVAKEVRGWVNVPDATLRPKESVPSQCTVTSPDSSEPSWRVLNSRPLML